jgi:hypothetical protein
MRPDTRPPSESCSGTTGAAVFTAGVSAARPGCSTSPRPRADRADRLPHTVGDAGQRVQGFLSKLGLTRSYVLDNAHPFALHPAHYRPY